MGATRKESGMKTIKELSEQHEAIVAELNELRRRLKCLESEEAMLSRVILSRVKSYDFDE